MNKKRRPRIEFVTQLNIIRGMLRMNPHLTISDAHAVLPTWSRWNVAKYLRLARRRDGLPPAKTGRPKKVTT